MSGSFTSNFAIGDTVVASVGLTEVQHGVVVAVRFTKGKVFYDILADYDARVYLEIPSDDVKAYTP
jgi:hypothetical protein